MSKTIEEIEKNLKSITDRLDMLDPLVQGKKHLYFRCSHSGLYFPADYIREWGRKYGKGLDKWPVSECWDSMYNIFPTISKHMNSLADTMHPIRSSCAPINDFFASREIPKELMLFTDIDDADKRKRVKVIIANQRKNPRNKLDLARGIAKQEGVL